MHEYSLLSEIRRGFAANLPLGAGVAAYGTVLGVMAAQKDIGIAVLLFMNITVFAGSAQFVMVDLWKEHLAVFEIIVAVAAINLRYLLMSAALRPLFIGKSFFTRLWAMHLVADENWATTISEMQNRGAGIFFLLGGGLCILSAWCAGTAAGHIFGRLITRPEAFAFDFAFFAVFAGILAGLWRGKQDSLCWIVAAVIAVLFSRWLPGKWYVAVGGLAGAAAGAFFDKGET